MATARRKLGEILVADGAVTAADVQSALADQSSGEPARLGDLLVSMGKVTPHQLARALGKQYGVPFTELPPIPPAILELVPMEFQRQFRFVPLKVGKGSISIAMADLSHASADVLPVLRRRFPTVQILVAPGDAIDAVHAAVAVPANVALPSVAPAIAPVIGGSPAPSSEERFKSIALDLVASSPGPSTVGADDKGPASDGLLEDAPFFEAAPRTRPVAALDDRAFVDNVPTSSPSSLAKLVIGPDPAPLSVVSPPDLKATMATARNSAILRPPAVSSSSSSSSSPSRITLPEWMAGEAQPVDESEGWTGALDALAPSKLMVAVTKALLRRGLLTEQEIIDVSELKKR